MKEIPYNTHALYVYGAKHDRIELFLQFSRRKEWVGRILYILDKSSIELVKQMVSYLHLPENEEAIKFVPIECIVTDNGEKPEESLSASIEKEYHMARGAGFDGLRVVIDMGWCAREIGHDIVFRIEKNIEGLFTSLRIGAVCLIEFGFMSREQLLQLRDMHTDSYISHGLLENIRESADVNGVEKGAYIVGKLAMEAAAEYGKGLPGFSVLPSVRMGTDIKTAELLAGNLLWILDKNWVIRFSSPSVTQLLNKQPEDYIGYNLSDFVDEQGVRLFSKGAERMGKKVSKGIKPPKEEVFFLYTSENGTSFPIHCEVGAITWGNRIAGYTCSLNILLNNDYLEQEKHSYHTLFSEIASDLPGGIVLADREGKIIYSNKVFEKLAGMKHFGNNPLLGELPLWDNYQLIEEEIIKSEEKGERTSRIEGEIVLPANIRKKSIIYVVMLPVLQGKKTARLLILFPRIEGLSELPSAAGTEGKRIKNKNFELPEWYSVSGEESSLVKFLKNAGVTVREHEILLLILKGLRNKEIGKTLNIAEITVKKHISNIYTKLQVKNRIELIRAIGPYLGWFPDE